MYRAVYADGSTLFVRHGREAMTEEIRAFAGAEGRGRVRALLRLVGRSLPDGDAVVHRRQLRLAARPGEALARRSRAGQARRVRTARQEGRLVLRRRAAPPDLHVPVDVRRSRPVRSPRALCRDHLHGLGPRGLRARRRHAHDRHGSRGRGHGGRRRHPARHSRHVDHARRRRQRHRRRGGRRSAHRGRRRRVQRRSPRGLPRTARPRGPAGRAPGQVLAVVCALGRRGARPAAAGRRPSQHPLRCAIGTARSGHSSTTACGCPTRRSSSPCTASTTPRSRRPAVRASTCSSRHPTSTTERRDRLGERARPDRRRPATPDEFARISHRRRRRGGVRPDGLGTHGNGTRHPVRTRPHVLPDRALPTEQRQSPGARARVHRIVDAPRRRRARWCSCRASSRHSASTSTPRRGAGRDGALPSLACRADTDHPPAADRAG